MPGATAAVADDDEASAGPAAATIVRRRFQAPGPDRLWIANITFVPTWEGYLFLAVVIEPGAGDA